MRLLNIFAIIWLSFKVTLRLSSKLIVEFSGPYCTENGSYCNKFGAYFVFAMITISRVLRFVNYNYALKCTCLFYVQLNLRFNGTDHELYKFAESRNTNHWCSINKCLFYSRKKSILEITFNRIKGCKSQFSIYIYCNCFKAVKFKSAAEMCYLNKVNTIIWRTQLWPLLLDNIEIHLRWREVIRNNILLGTRLSVPKSFNYREGKPNWGDTFIMKNNACKLAKVGVGGLIRSPLRICSCRFS